MHCRAVYFLSQPVITEIVFQIIEHFKNSPGHFLVAERNIVWLYMPRLASAFGGSTLENVAMSDQAKLF